MDSGTSGMWDVSLNSLVEVDTREGGEWEGGEYEA